MTEIVGPEAIRRTNRYQKYYMPSQHIYCGRVWNSIQARDVQSNDQKVYIYTPPSSEVENLLPHWESNPRPAEPERTFYHLSQRGELGHGDMLRKTRHHKVCSLIAQVFRDRKFHVYEEVHGVSETGSREDRRVDIIAIQPCSSLAIIIDPMIRWEINDDQPVSVHKGKRSIC